MWKVKRNKVKKKETINARFEIRIFLERRYKYFPLSPCGVKELKKKLEEKSTRRMCYEILLDEYLISWLGHGKCPHLVEEECGTCRVIVI